MVHRDKVRSSARFGVFAEPELFTSAFSWQAMSQAFIVAAKRTPFGAFGGSLKSHTAAQLGGLASKAALAELPSNVKVDATIFGAVLQSDPSGAYVARHVGHHAGLPVEVPALTVNRCATFVALVCVCVLQLLLT